MNLNLPNGSDMKPSVELEELNKLNKEQSKRVAWGFVALIILMIVVALVSFFLALRGNEETMVPDVNGMELASGLIKLQDKDLYPHITLRFTDDVKEKGRIVEQSPLAGTIVKAGRRIQLTVSRGPMIDRVENYVGGDINALKIHLQTLFASSTPLVTIKEPPVYIHDKAPAGTVLQQKPLPDTPIDGPVALDLIVSSGPENAQIQVPELRGLDFSSALALIERGNIAVTFTMRQGTRSERPGAVVSETPVPGSSIPSNGRLSVTVTAPAPEKGMVSGLFSRDLPEYPYPLKVSLDATLPNGEKQRIVSLNHPGGNFSAPYNLPDGSVLVLTVLDREVARMEVKTE